MSQYNLKSFDYGEFVQYRIYDRVISKSDEEPEKRENNINQDDFVKDKERSEKVSINRTIQTIYKYAQANQWEWFVTLTFKRDGKVDVYNYSDVVKKLSKWLNNQRAKCPDLKYLFVPEMHKDGAFHFHGLLADCDQLTFTDSGRVSDGGKAYKRTEENADKPTIYNMDQWKYGFSTATKVQENVRVSSYICKYITKDLIRTIGRRRRFYPSNNLDQPLESEMLWKKDDIDDLLKDIGDQLEYIKTQTISAAHQRITYVTVKKEKGGDTYGMAGMQPLQI